MRLATLLVLIVVTHGCRPPFVPFVVVRRPCKWLTMREAKNVQRPRIRTQRAFEPRVAGHEALPVADRSKTSKTADVRSERCPSRENVRRLAPCTPRTSNDVARRRRWCREGGCYVVVNLQ